MTDTTNPTNPTTNGLDRETKQKIRNWVLKLRHLFQDDITKQLRRVGIEAGKPITPEGPGYLEADEKRARRVIVAAIQRDAANERSQADALTAYVRECAYTLLNRLVGLKCMEAREILFVEGEPTEVVTTKDIYGNRSRLLWQMRDAERRYREDETLLWRDGLTRAFRAVTQDIALLFDPDSEWSQVWPTQKTLMEAVKAINGLDAECKRGPHPPAPSPNSGRGGDSVFASPDFLGWVYQFFNVEEKEEIRAETGGRPRTSHELAVINQFYTPDWIVKFLVDNTLGRVWLRMHPDTRLRERIGYLVPNTGEDEPAPLKPVREIKLLDPACGTMHFGQYAYGLFYAMYLEEQDRAGSAGWPSESSVLSVVDIPSAILANNLFGIDIDPRAIQIAALTLLLTMKEQARAHGLDPQAVRVERMNLVCADAVNLGEEQREEFIRSLDPAVFGSVEPLRPAIRAIWQNLQHVAELGSLVQVGEEVERALAAPTVVRRRLAAPGQPTLEGGEEWGKAQPSLSEEERSTVRAKLEEALADYARSHTGAEDINQRLFAQETGKAVHLLDLLRQRYDVVVMNPPYGDPTEDAKAILKRHNADNWVDNYSVFTERAVSLVHPQRGYVGALTSRTFLYLSSFSYLRTQLMLGRSTILTLADLGSGVLDGATVQTAAFVLQAATLDSQVTCYRLERPSDKHAVFAEALHDPRSALVYHRPHRIFRGLPDSILAYAMPDALADAFTAYRSLREELATLKVGVGTGDDEWFCRHWWELACKVDNSDSKWKLFAKGGEFSPYYQATDLIVDWEHNGAGIKRHPKSKYGRGMTHYFTSGFTWSSTSSIGLNVQYWPGGVFSIKGMAGFTSNTNRLWACIGFLNSHLADAFAKAINPGRDYQVGHLNRIPVPAFPEEWVSYVGTHAKHIHQLKARWDSSNETTPCSGAPWLVAAACADRTSSSLLQLVKDCLDQQAAADEQCRAHQRAIDDAVYSLYRFSADDRDVVERELGARPPEIVWPQMAGKSEEEKRNEHVLRLLSYLVKTSIEADEDGIISLVPCGTETTLVERVRRGLDEAFGADRGPAIESEVNNFLGKRQTIETWLARQYFKYHVQLYKRRPIFWHITTEDGSFGALVHYHRFTHDRLQKLRSHTLYGHIQRLLGEIGRLKGDTSSEAREKLSTLEQGLDAARALDENLRKIQEGEYPIKVPWKSAADQPKGWRPDIDDGVKVNIGPFEAAGVLAVKKVC